MYDIQQAVFELIVDTLKRQSNRNAFLRDECYQYNILPSKQFASIEVNDSLTTLLTIYITLQYGVLIQNRAGVETYRIPLCEPDLEQIILNYIQNYTQSQI